MAKDILISESSLLYLSKQTKLLQSEDRSVRNLHCHTCIKLRLHSKYCHNSDSFLLMKSGFGHSQHPATGNAAHDCSCYNPVCRWTQRTESGCVLLSACLQPVLVSADKHLDFYQSSSQRQLLGSLKPLSAGQCR